MQLIEWDDSLYSVSIDEFDNHHKKLVGFINKLHQAMLNGQGKKVLQDILNELQEYTNYHFAAEEKQMQECNYPEYPEHKTQHEDLTQQLSDIIQNYHWGKREISIDTLKFLKEWLFRHIQVSDKKYTPYMKK
jgi:hemerythrin